MSAERPKTLKEYAEAVGERLKRSKNGTVQAMPAKKRSSRKPEKDKK